MGARDEDRFTRLVRTHTPAVGDYLRRRLYPLGLGDLDDLVEETFIVVWRRLDDVPEDAEAAWIVGVARNVLRNARRTRGRRRSIENTLRARGAQASAEERVVADLALADALAALSEDEREIVLLNAWDGLDTHALAAVYGVSVNAAAVRLSRALARLRDRLAATEVAKDDEGARQ